MDPTLIIAMIGATALLVAIPGPNVALIVANTLASGARYGAVTVLGTTVGIAVQLALVVLGLSALLAFATTAFIWLKWLGVAYLVWLAVMAWREGRADIDMPDSAQGTPLRRRFWQGLMLAVINPKTLIFNAVFLPQFVQPEAGPGALVVVALIYLAVIALGDLVWVASAQVARPAILRLGRWRHRLTGGLYMGSAVGLTLARIER